jgi:hypothetical protein
VTIKYTLRAGNWPNTANSPLYWRRIGNPTQLTETHLLEKSICQPQTASNSPKSNLHRHASKAPYRIPNPQQLDRIQWIRHVPRNAATTNTKPIHSNLNNHVERVHYQKFHYFLVIFSIGRAFMSPVRGSPGCRCASCTVQQSQYLCFRGHEKFSDLVLSKAAASMPTNRLSNFITELNIGFDSVHFQTMFSFGPIPVFSMITELLQPL